ncbi:hypothetical protein FBZ82_107212 [Azospirillum brasilense]|uniref:Uncharacterized protein n=1 Tax=Azospirillum brasilense TaxID=192 RepID=A0A560B3M8_AZOBR|nr:hypothetical protein [Azospirillum brasilense]TWA67236.1 hypothetical protein FBZ82_107212 [Azospirillum brasilense]
MPCVPPNQRKIAAATTLLANPGPYDADPIFAQIPREAWAERGYQYTLTVQWSNVPVTDLPAITVRAHVHYRWNGNAWTKMAGNAWISGLNDWSTQTTGAVVAMTPGQPPDQAYHA